MAITMDGIFVNGQKVTFHPENILSGDVSAYTEEIGTTVEEWLEENVTGGEQVTDTTLTLPGVPADAEVTGDKIDELKEDLNSIRSNPINLFEMKGFTPNGTKTDVTISGNTFTVATNQSAEYSGVYKYIDLDPNTTYCISCVGTKNLDTSVISAYYAESTDGGETYPSSSKVLFSNRASGKRYITYFTTTTGKVRLAFYCTTSTTASGSVTYSDIILTKGLDYYGYFVPAGGAVDASANRLSEMVFAKLAQGFGREFTQADIVEASSTRLNIQNLSVTSGDVLVFHRGTNPIEMLVECYSGSTFVKQFDYVALITYIKITVTCAETSRNLSVAYKFFLYFIGIRFDCGSRRAIQTYCVRGFGQ